MLQKTLQMAYWNRSCPFFPQIPDLCRLSCLRPRHGQRNNEMNRVRLQLMVEGGRIQLWQILQCVKIRNKRKSQSYILLELEISGLRQRKHPSNSPVWASSRCKAAPFEFSKMRSRPFHNGHARSPQLFARWPSLAVRGGILYTTKQPCN